MLGLKSLYIEVPLPFDTFVSIYKRFSKSLSVKLTKHVYVDALNLFALNFSKNWKSMNMDQSPSVKVCRC